MPVTRLFLFFVITVLVNGASGAMGAEICPLNPNDPNLRNFKGEAIYFSATNDANLWKVCTRMSNCQWGPLKSDKEALIALDPFLEPDSAICSKNYDPDKKAHRRFCDKTTLEDTGIKILIGRFLRDVVNQTPEATCGNTNSPSRSTKKVIIAESANNINYLVYQLPVGRYSSKGSICLQMLVRSLDFAGVVLMTTNCKSQSELSLILQVLEEKTPFDPNWLWLVTLDGPVGLGLKIKEVAGEITSGNPTEETVWGLLEPGLVTAWLQKVTAAAKQTSLGLAEVNLPLYPDISETNEIGRLLHWLAAITIRLEITNKLNPIEDDIKRSRTARDWMVRNILTRQSGFQGTLLRVEELK